jgi:hypothetical protein
VNKTKYSRSVNRLAVLIVGNKLSCLKKFRKIKDLNERPRFHLFGTVIAGMKIEAEV